jgi:putative oxidoreductase
MKIGRLLLRLVIGGLFIGHGTQKLFGWFGGYGPDATGEFFEQTGLRPGRPNAIAAGAAEAGGGALLAAGLATPLAAATLTSVMLTAIKRVHISKGPWVSDGGYEYNLVLIAAVLALVDAGPGSLSLDGALGTEHSGPAWTLAALAGGALGAYGVDALAAREGAPEAPEPSPAESDGAVASPETAPEAPAAQA